MTSTSRYWPRSTVTVVYNAAVAPGMAVQAPNCAQRDHWYVIVGEPTESKFARASKGALTCTLHFDGVAAHSAYPERGDSAIARMIAAIGEIHRTDWGMHDILGNATVNVADVATSHAPPG